MKAWNEIKHYAGFDWAKDHHDVIVLDAGGKTVAEFRFDHTAVGWDEFSKKLAAFPNVAIAVETNHGGVIERLLERECCVFPVHTRSAKGYRQRKVPSGNKTDKIDAWSLADALRLDGAHWKPLSAQDLLIKELRLLCRDEVALIRDRTARATRLRHGCWQKSATTARCFPMRKVFNVWPALRRSVISPARFIACICAASATSHCATSCICGQT